MLPALPATITYRGVVRLPAPFAAWFDITNFYQLFQSILLKLSMKDSNLLPRTTYSMPVSVRLVYFEIATHYVEDFETPISLRFTLTYAPTKDGWESNPSSRCVLP